MERNVCVSYTVHIQMNINGLEESSIRRDGATDKSSQGNAPGDKRRLLYWRTHIVTGKKTRVQMSVLHVCLGLDVCLYVRSHRGVFMMECVFVWRDEALCFCVRV